MNSANLEGSSPLSDDTRGARDFLFFPMKAALSVWPLRLCADSAMER